MSFRQDFLKARLSKLPAQAPSSSAASSSLQAVMPGARAGAEDVYDEDEEEEELDEFDVNSVPSTSAGFMKPRGAGQGNDQHGSTNSTHGTKDYSPLSAQGYFSQALAVNVTSTTGQNSGDNEEPSTSHFRVYYTPSSISRRRSNEDEDDDDTEAVVFVCHHGAGYSAMSFALFAKEIAELSNGTAGVLALDCRGHGKTVCRDESDMAIDVLADDLVNVLKEVYPNKSTCPDLVLVGHSMGGSVVVKACSRIQQEVGNVVGVCNLDVVEGTAMEALSGMTDIVSSRPKGFASLEDAIAWHVRTKTIGSLQSARISVPPLFIKEEEEKDDKLRYKWRTNLIATQPYWEGWFKQLSSSFLSQRCAKLLVLAGAESLDKDLMIGQMQGKYQLTVFQDVGHCLQEEAPRRLGVVLLEFWKRNLGARDQARILKNVKKVGQS